MSHRRKQNQLLENVIGLEYRAGQVMLGAAGTPTTGVSLVQEFHHFSCQRVNFDSLVLTVTDSGGANGGVASKALFTFPAKRIMLLGALGTCNVVAGANISATASIANALGSAAATVASLSGTAADITGSTNFALTASAGVCYVSNGIQFAQSNYSGGTTQCFLNFGVPDASISANSTLTLTNGVFRVYYLELGA